MEEISNIGTGYIVNVEELPDDTINITTGWNDRMTGGITLSGVEIVRLVEWLSRRQEKQDD